MPILKFPVFCELCRLPCFPLASTRWQTDNLGIELPGQLINAVAPQANVSRRDTNVFEVTGMEAAIILRIVAPIERLHWVNNVGLSNLLRFVLVAMRVTKAMASSSCRCFEAHKQTKDGCKRPAQGLEVRKGVHKHLSPEKSETVFNLPQVKVPRISSLIGQSDVE